MTEKQPTEPMAQPGKKGSKEWRYLRDTYHVTQSLIIQKIFHIAPWKGPGLRFSWQEWSSKAWIFKLICHVALLVLVTTLITIINWQWAGYQRAAAAISCRYFLPNTNLCSFDDCIGHLSTVHPTINMHDLESAILTAVREYYHINTTSIAQLEHPFQNAAGNAFDNCQPNNDVPSATILIPVPVVAKTPEDTKPAPPLAPAALYNISHTFTDTTHNGHPSGHLKTTATASSIPPSSVQSTPQGSMSASLSDPLPPPLTPEDKQRRSLKFWQQLSYRVKLRLLDGWRLLSIAGALLSLAAACIFVQVRLGYYAVYFPGGVLGGDTPRLMLGLAAAIQYLALLSYLRYSNRFTASALVLWGAFFKVQRIFFAVLPLAIGLALLGILVFGNSAETFGDLEAMSITLFSLMNCDSIWQTFVDTTTFSRTNVSFVGTLYVSAVFIVFNYLLLRLVLAVVESLYYYLRLYTSACRKRGLFRAQILQSQQDDGQELRAYATAAGVRAHSSQEIQLSLFRIYAKQQLASTPSPSPSSATVAPSSGAAGRTGQNHSYHREQTLADALMAASIPTETQTSS
eukprot:gene830-593_t